MATTAALENVRRSSSSCNRVDSWIDLHIWIPSQMEPCNPGFGKHGLTGADEVGSCRHVKKHDKDWLQGTDYYEGCKAVKRLRRTSWAASEPREEARDRRRGFKKGHGHSARCGKAFKQEKKQ